MEDGRKKSTAVAGGRISIGFVRLGEDLYTVVLCVSCAELCGCTSFFFPPKLHLALSQASPVWISQHSAALLPAPKGFPPLGFLHLAAT